MNRQKSLIPISSFLKNNRDNMIHLTQELCAFQTINPPGLHCKEIADFLAAQMRETGFSAKVIRVPDSYAKKYISSDSWNYPRFNVIARWNTGAKKTLHFNSHFDVVPVTSDWKTDPFSPVLKRGRLYGRGTSDMKGCITSCIYAMKAIRECGMEPSWNLEVSFTCDEEIGGHCGAGYIVKEGIVKPNAAIICEGGAGDSIMMGHRGVLWLDIQIQGKSAHGSNPDAGINAFEKGIHLAGRITDYHKQCQLRETSHMMDRVSARRPSMTLGGISGGGTKVNTIPNQFHFTIDRRLIPEEKSTQVKKEFKNIIQMAMQEDPSLQTKMNVLMEFDAAITDSDSSICQTAQNAVQQITGKMGRLRVFGAFTDMHFFVDQADCPSIGYGVEGDGIHGSNEYLQVKSLVDTAAVYAQIALNIH